MNWKEGLIIITSVITIMGFNVGFLAFSINPRFEAMDSRFEAINSRSEAMDKKMDALINRMDALINRFDEDRQATNQRIDGLYKIHASKKQEK